MLPRLCAALLVPTLFAASAGAQDPSPVATWAGAAAGDEFGATVQTVGDVDADGVRDIAVGAPYAFGTIFSPDQGTVSVYSGATLAPLWTAYGDEGSEFGSAITNAGDVDLDGRDDVLVGAPAGDGAVADSGYVELRSGLDGTLLLRVNGFQTDQRFGEALCAGPLDGLPGPWEVAVGSPGHDLDDTQGGVLQEGFVSIHRLTDGVPIKFLPGSDYFYQGAFGVSGTWDRRHWGAALAYAGDSDGDGLGELVVSAPFSHFAFTGAPTRFNTGFLRGFEPFGDDPDPIDFSAIGFDAGEFLGRELISLGGDLDGNGAPDFAFSIPGADRVDVRTQPLSLNGSGGMWLTLTDACASDASVLGAPGDLDADGVVDLALGSPGFGVGAIGSVCLYTLKDNQLLTTLVSAEVADRFGSAVAGVDTDGDGRNEVAVGIPRDDTLAEDAGAVIVYTGFACPADAGWENYGSGLPGAFGVPSLTVTGAPTLGESFEIHVGNAAGVGALAFAFVGFEPAATSVKGGTLLVSASQLKQFVLPPAGASFALSVADDPVLCGLIAYVQVLHADPSAIRGVAFTKGLQLSFGL